MTQALQDLLTPDIHTKGVPTGHGAITGYSPALVARIIDAAFEQAAENCDAISADKWSLYKGRPPYTGREPERASDQTQGESDGADDCADAIRARKGSMKP